jgi:hypothetical protein
MNVKIGNEVVNFTQNEIDVLKSIEKTGSYETDAYPYYEISEIVKETGKTVSSIKGILGSLQKKGIVNALNDTEGYFDGEVRRDAMEVFKTLVKEVEVADEVVDNDLVKLNEILDTKLSSVSAKQREKLKVAKNYAKCVAESWDDADVLIKMADDDEVNSVDLGSYDVIFQIVLNRIDKLIAQKPKEEVKKEAAPKQQPSYMKLYHDVKAKHANCVLLFRVGDMYAAYDEDAVEISEILYLRWAVENDLKVVRFPYHALDTYLPKLVRAGKRIAICDESNKSNKVETKHVNVSDDNKPKDKRSSGGHNVGDVHPNGKWVWTEYKPGRFDWRTDKSGKTTKETQKQADSKHEEESQATETVVRTIDEIMSSKLKGISKSQEAIYKLLKRGYRVQSVSGKSVFMQLNDDKKTVELQAISALFKRMKLNDDEAHLFGF